MITLENAVTETLEELELEDYIEAHIREVQEDRLYHVTFQERQNGNNRMVIHVEYSSEVGDLMDDESWEPELQEVYIVSREGIGPGTAMMILELLAITLDGDWFDEDSDDETISSQPLTPPPSRVRRG